MRENGVEAFRIQRAGRVDTVRRLPRVPANFSHRQPGRPHQEILGGQHRAATIAQQVAGAIAAGPQTRDTIGVCTGQQHACHIARCDPQRRSAGPVDLVVQSQPGQVPGLLPDPLEPALQPGGTCLLAHQHRQADRDIRTLSGQGIALRQDGGEQAGGFLRVDITADQQHMSQPRVQGHLRHPHALRCQLVPPLPVAVDSATTFEYAQPLLE